jgi:hypothetical protein
MAKARGFLGENGDGRAMSHDGGTTYWYIDDDKKIIHTSIQGGPWGRRAAPTKTEGDADDVEDMLYEAWVVIANANGWDSPSEWRAAAERWRDRWHAYLGSTKPVPPKPETDVEDTPSAERPPGCDCDAGEHITGCPAAKSDDRPETPGA